MVNPIINVEKLSCKYGKNYLLKDITWSVNNGEKWVVFGMNGSGKTTLLSIIAGYKESTSGNLQVFGQNYTDSNILETRKRIGWVSTSFFDKIYTTESILDIVISGKYGTLGLSNTLSTMDIRYAKEILMEFGLSRQIDYTFDMLSKGERQNVLIARALFSDPEILVLDEPCSGLDIYNREYLFQTIEKIAVQKDMTIIYVTHYVDEIKKMFDHCLLLKNGREFLHGTTETIFQEQIMKDFLGYDVIIQRDSTGEINLTVPGVESRMDRCLATREAGGVQ